MTAHPLATYLADCRARRGTGATTPETSLYGPLEALVSAAGHSLKPRVRCFMSLKDQGAGLPDGGLFTPDQIARGFPAAKCLTAYRNPLAGRFPGAFRK